MRSRLVSTLIAAAAAAALLAGPVAHAGTRVEVQRYTAGLAGDAVIWLPRCDAAVGGPNVGGACFALNPGDTAISFAVSDDVWTSGIEGEVEFLTASNSIIARHAADCRGMGPFTIPAGAAWAKMTLYGPGMGLINLACSSVREPTRGTITATVTTSASPGRVVSVATIAGTHGLNWCYPSTVVPALPTLGGACFTVQPGETQVSLVATFTPSANAPFTIEWEDANGDAIALADYCNATGWLAIPPGTVKVNAYSSALAYAYPCGTPAPLAYPIVGTYTATFR